MSRKVEVSRISVLPGSMDKTRRVEVTFEIDIGKSKIPVTIEVQAKGFDEAAASARKRLNDIAKMIQSETSTQEV